MMRDCCFATVFSVQKGGAIPLGYNCPLMVFFGVGLDFLFLVWNGLIMGRQGI